MSKKKSSLIAAILFYVVAVSLSVVFSDQLQNSVTILIIGGLDGIAIMYFWNFLKEPKAVIKNV